MQSYEGAALGPPTRPLQRRYWGGGDPPESRRGQKPRPNARADGTGGTSSEATSAPTSAKVPGTRTPGGGGGGGGGNASGPAGHPGRPSLPRLLAAGPGPALTCPRGCRAEQLTSGMELNVRRCSRTRLPPGQQGACNHDLGGPGTPEPSPPRTQRGPSEAGSVCSCHGSSHQPAARDTQPGGPRSLPPSPGACTRSGGAGSEETGSSAGPGLDRPLPPSLDPAPPRLDGASAPPTGSHAPSELAPPLRGPSNHIRVLCRGRCQGDARAAAAASQRRCCARAGPDAAGAGAVALQVRRLPCERWPSTDRGSVLKPRWAGNLRKEGLDSHTPPRLYSFGLSRPARPQQTGSRWRERGRCTELPATSCNGDAGGGRRAPLSGWFQFWQMQMR